MTEQEIALARADIEATDDLLARSLKLAGLLTTLFRRQGISLVVVGGSAVEFYTEGGYMSGDIVFCRRSLKSPTPRQIHDILAPIGGTCIGRNWKVCGIVVDLTGIVEMEAATELRDKATKYGSVKIMSPELILVECLLKSLASDEYSASIRRMIAKALEDSLFDWKEAERLAALPDFDVLGDLRRICKESA